MSESKYRDRQGFEMEHWPELRSKANELTSLVLGEGQIPRRLKFEIFTVASQSAGCRHCQSHGAFLLNKTGTVVHRFKALWSYETSKLFTDAERPPLILPGSPTFHRTYLGRRILRNCASTIATARLLRSSL